MPASTVAEPPIEPVIVPPRKKSLGCVVPEPAPGFPDPALLTTRVFTLTVFMNKGSVLGRAVTLAGVNPKLSVEK